jgi:hypothetical protein
VAGAVESHQPQKARQKDVTIAAFGFEDSLHYLSNARLVQRSIDETKPKQTPGFAHDLSGRFHLFILGLVPS